MSEGDNDQPIPPGTAAGGAFFVHEAAVELGVKIPAVYRWISLGKLSALKSRSGRVTGINPDELERFKRERARINETGQTGGGTRPGSRAQKGANVYVIGQDDQRLVKIGWSLQVSKRLVGLQTGSPYQLAVLWQAEGGAKVESALHLRFSGQRVRGEWFEFPDGDAVERIARAYQANLRPDLSEHPRSN